VGIGVGERLWGVGHGMLMGPVAGKAAGKGDGVGEWRVLLFGRGAGLSMKLLERIQSDLTAAMKEKDELRLSVLRMVKTALKHREIEKMRPLEEAEELQALQTLVKQRRESAEQYAKGGRADLAEIETREIGIIESYMPAGASEEDMKTAIAAAIVEIGAKTPQQMGSVVKAAKARLAGKTVDGKALSDLVRERLAHGG
jgi:uncharacterized protein YqeY